MLSRAEYQRRRGRVRDICWSFGLERYDMSRGSHLRHPLAYRARARRSRRVIIRTARRRVFLLLSAYL